MCNPQGSDLVHIGNGAAHFCVSMRRRCVHKTRENLRQGLVKEVWRVAYAVRIEWQ